MDKAIDKNGFGYLHIEPKHTAALMITEGIPIVSGDPVLDSYPIERRW